jgi:Protein of unknown function (DUF2892)
MQRMPTAAPEEPFVSSTPATVCSLERRGWPLERVVFAMAGAVTLLSALLTATVTPWFGLLTAFVGVNQWLFVAFGACPASLLLGRVFDLTPQRLTPTGGPSR